MSSPFATPPSPGALERSTRADGALVLRAAGAEFAFLRPCPGVLLVTIAGSDHGQFGDAALDEIRLEVLRRGPIALYIDAASTTNVSVHVSREWTRFFSSQRGQLERVVVLTGSKLIHLSVEIAQHLSQTGGLIFVTNERERFLALYSARIQAA